MKKIFALLVALLLCASSGCSNLPEGDVTNVQIDYGESALYSKEDMDDAIRVIEKKFRTWKGFKLHSISYVSDDKCGESSVRWLNELEEANDSKEHFTQCIVFESGFHTAKNDEGFEEDADYAHWQWWLARSDGGKWKLMTWGY